MKNEKLRMKLHLNSMNYHMKYHISVINLQSCQKNTHMNAMFGILWNLCENPWEILLYKRLLANDSIPFLSYKVLSLFQEFYIYHTFHIHILIHIPKACSCSCSTRKKIFANCFPKGELCNLKLLPRLQTMDVSGALLCHFIEFQSPRFSPIISNFHGFSYLCTNKIYAQSEY
jgi:hypothetical protein